VVALERKTKRGGSLVEEERTVVDWWQRKRISVVLGFLLICEVVSVILT
jgi:hypothetical protein